MALFGHSSQFRKLLEHNWQRLYRVAYAWTHESFLAHDLVQETIARALAHKDKITDARALEVWLFRVMTNYWRDLFRQRKAVTDIDEAGLIDDNTPDHTTERTRLVSQVRQAISQLNHNQRQVIALVAMEGFSYDEVARILDIPVGTVMSRLCRARQALKHLLDPALDNHAAQDRVRRLK